MEASVDLERYPIAAVGSRRYHQLVAAARKALLGEDGGQSEEGASDHHDYDDLGRAGGGVCMLPGFFRDDAIRLAIDDALSAEPHAFRSDNEHNIYLEEDEEALTGESERTGQGVTRSDVIKRAQHSSKTCVTYDQVSPSSPLHALYNRDPLMDFLAAVLGKEKLYHTADQLGALNVHIYHQDDELGWHFDRGEFAVSLLLQSADAADGGVGGGGHFEYAPHLRSNDDQRYSDVMAVLDEGQGETDDSSMRRRIHRLDITPGALVFFCGRHSLHRVTKVTGDRPRVIAILSFETKPGVELNDYTRLKFFGRTSSASATPATTT